jgi:hypothetical protein
LIEDKTQLKEMKNDALAWINKIKKLGGIPFEMPQDLLNASMILLALPS